jgi:site-specific DNA-methyltransferase (adenine-specific)
MRRNTVLVGDALTRLRKLPEGSVDTIVTSPPYFLLRDYGVPGQYGLEQTVDEWVEHLAAVAGEMARVLKPTGSLWLNVGDSYSRADFYGMPPKGLLLGPERLLLRLVADGWLCRNKVVWAKTNYRPASVRDRLTCAHESFYLLVRSPRYFFDLDAVRVPHRSRRTPPRRRTHPSGRPTWAGPLAGDHAGLDRQRALGRVGHPLGKNPGDVWRLAASNYRGAHFATFPEALVERPLRATCPERVCAACGTPWQREPVTRALGEVAVLGALRRGCTCNGGSAPGLVLDPFMGAGTVAVVARRLGRDYIGIELNPAFARLARQRLAGSPSEERRE